MFFEFPCIFEKIRIKRKTFRQSWTKRLYPWLLHILIPIPFTTRETELDYYHKKVKVRVAERLKT